MSHRFFKRKTFKYGTFRRKQRNPSGPRTWWRAMRPKVHIIYKEKIDKFTKSQFKTFALWKTLLKELKGRLWKIFANLQYKCFICKLKVQFLWASTLSAIKWGGFILILRKPLLKKLNDTEEMKRILYQRVGRISHKGSDHGSPVLSLQESEERRSARVCFLYSRNRLPQIWKRQIPTFIKMAE